MEVPTWAEVGRWASMNKRRNVYFMGNKISRKIRVRRRQTRIFREFYIPLRHEGGAGVCKNKRPGENPARLKVTTKSKPAYENLSSMCVCIYQQVLKKILNIHIKI